MARSFPYYKMYPSDAEMDEKHRALDDADLGFYWRCLNHAWSNGGSIPADLAELARSLKKTVGYVEKRWTLVGRCWGPHPADNSRLINPRQFQEWTEAREKSQNNARAVRTRYERSTNDVPRALMRADSDSVSDFEYSERKKEKPEVYLGQNADFGEFWAEYWRRVAKVAAHAAYHKHVNSHELHELIMQALAQQKPVIVCREMEARPHASTWLNQHRWEDDPQAYRQSPLAKPASAMQRRLAAIAGARDAS